MTTTSDHAVLERDATRPTLRQRLGEAMAHQRQRKGLTQLELANAAEISTKYLGEVERGEANVSIDVIERIASVLGWDPYRLFATDPPPIDEEIRARLMGALGSLQGSLSSQVTTLLDSLAAVGTTARVLNGARTPDPVDAPFRLDHVVPAVNGLGDHDAVAKAV
jgi:transcriptional regulator with XRE-family HTH domain